MSFILLTIIFVYEKRSPLATATRFYFAVLFLVVINFIRFVFVRKVAHRSSDVRVRKFECFK